MACPPAPSVASTKETTNYARLCRLLVGVGSQALRDTFDRIHPQAGLHAVLAPGTSAHTTLQSLRTKRILNSTQWGNLYPTIPASVSSASFDITLLMVLLRNICHLKPPISGWDKLPSAADMSTEANIARVKYYRNTVYGHASQASVDDVTFNSQWQDISNALVTLGGASYAAAINKLKNECMDPDTEEHYRKRLKEWKRDEDSIKEKLEKMEEVLKQVKEEKGDIKDKLGQVEENLKGTLEQVGHQVKNVSEKFDSLKESIQDEDKTRNDLKEMKTEIRTISEKLKSQITSGEEENSRDNLELMKTEIADIKEKLDTLMNRLRLEETKVRIKDDFDPAEIIDRIRQLYKVREGWLAPFPWCEEFLFHFDSIFIRLKVVSRKKTRGTATDNIVNMSGIFKPHEECPQPRTVLIEGKPGMGKTTYCQKMVYDWATGKREEDDCFPSFQTVLLLKCRDMKSSLWEAIDDQVLPREVGEDVRERFFNFICQNQSNVLLVLDGLDEVPSSKLPVFAEIIQGRRELPKCRVVATARHEAGIKLRIHCDTLLQIEGFTLEDAREFISKYFKDMKNLAEELLSKLEIDDNLRDMAANPLNTALLCLICEEFRGNFPEKRTQLYEEIIQCILRRYRKKKGLPETNEDLLKVYELQLKYLGRVALNGLLEDKLDFEESELKSHAELPGFGFLSVQTGGSKLRPRQHYSFLHKSFQECFAAIYLCCQLLNKEISVDKLAADRGYLKELKEVLSFTCGMVAARCKETAEALIKSITIQVNESEQVNEHEECFCALLAFISECRREDNNFHFKMARVSGSFLKLPYLHLRWSSISMAEVVLLAEVIKVNSTLTAVGLFGDDIDDQGATGLAEALKVNSTLTELVLYGNSIGDQGATGLAEALKVNSTLTELELYGNGIGDQGATGLAEALKVNSTLTELHLSGNDIGGQGATGLAEALKVNSTLSMLDLSVNDIGDQGATGLAEALKVNSTLSMLDLSGNDIGDQGATGLAEALKVNSTLTVLNLYGNDIGDQGATGLAEALKVNSTLTVLNLARNGIGDQGATGLAEVLKVNSTLTELYFSGNAIGDQGATGLAEALKVNSTLRVFRLEDNDIGATVRSELRRLEHVGLSILL